MGLLVENEELLLPQSRKAWRKKRNAKERSCSWEWWRWKFTDKRESTAEAGTSGESRVGMALSQVQNGRGEGRTRPKGQEGKEHIGEPK